ncbi:hypothetical protein MHTCC0001_25030 [Flavobacteriaceae bacterium MHTCC 0001]
MNSQLGSSALDLICCQEVFSAVDYTIGTEKYLKKELALPSFYFPSRKKERLVNGSKILSFSGLCIFTNLPVLKEEKIYLSTHIEDGERTAQLLTIKKEGKTIAIVNTHLTHLRNESELRCQQMHEILRYINFDAYDIVLICGDLNDTPNSKTITTLTENYSFKPALKSYPPTMGNRCIDYMFYRSKVALDILEAKLILNKASEEGIFPSDHFGILATFKL